MKIIGFDPGYGILGWGLIEPGPGSMSITPAKYGVITTHKDTPIQERLFQIHSQTLALLTELAPEHAVVECLFLNKNLKTAGDVYQARGVVLAAIAEYGCEMMEVQPNKIKQMVTGRGGANKAEVTMMVQRLLHIKEKIQPDDAADALAGAIAGSILVNAKNTFAVPTRKGGLK